jgi:hypothetical protein
LKITILVEGKTEKAFKPHLIAFLAKRLEGRMPRLDMFLYNGRIPKGADLRRTVENLLSGRQPSDAIIALTDVYTGTNEFLDAADAKAKMREWVGPDVSCFYPHVAQHDFEAWLLPYWIDIQKLAGHNCKAPAGAPEAVNHNHPPSHHLREIFRIGTCRDDYSKPRDAHRILRDKDLAISAAKCPELKAFLNTIIALSGGTPI